MLTLTIRDEILVIEKDGEQVRIFLPRKTKVAVEAGSQFKVFREKKK